MKLDEKCSSGISSSSQIVFFQSLRHTFFSSAICPCSAHCTTMLDHACLFPAGLTLIYLRKLFRKRCKDEVSYHSGPHQDAFSYFVCSLCASCRFRIGYLSPVGECPVCCLTLTTIPLQIIHFLFADLKR